MNKKPWKDKLTKWRTIKWQNFQQQCEVIDRLPNEIPRVTMFLIDQSATVSIQLTSDYPANTLTLNQRWNNVDRQCSSTLFPRWYLVENESWADICLPTLFQRWQNNVETALIEPHWFNADNPMLFQRWY